MKKIKLISQAPLWIVFISITYHSCRDIYESTPASAPKCYDKFISDYHVTDLQTGEEFDISIEKLGSDNQSQYDSLIIRNFANKFDVKFRFFCGSPDNYLSWSADFGITDDEGHSWALYNNVGDLAADTVTNVLLNSDTIYFDYKISISHFI